ncbi:MAG: CHAT domain-containing tetratricopeptide repeat protein [Cytophagales bacterium]|nr:CHAT domain-containing tetratricopeptide repeat protein [Cytophagales bacterium]
MIDSFAFQAEEHDDITKAKELQITGDFAASNETLNKVLASNLTPYQQILAYRLAGRNLVGLGLMDSVKYVMEQNIERGLKATDKASKYELAMSYRLLRFYYQRQGDYTSVRDCLNKALKIFENDTSNAIILRKTYYDMGAAYSRDFMPDEALPWLRKSLEILTNSDDPEVENDRRACLLQLAAVYSDKREMDRAITQFKLVLDLIKGKEKILVRDYMVACGNLGISYDELGELDSALVYYKKAYDNLDNMENSSFNAIVPRFRAKLQSDIGVVYRKKRDQKEALRYLNRGLNLGVDFFGEIHPLVGEFRYQLGYAEMEFGLFDDAEKTLLKVIDVYKTVEGGVGYRTTQGYNELGRLFGKKGMINESLVYYDSGLISNPQVILDGKKLYGSVTGVLRSFEGKLEIFDQIDSDSLKLSILTDIRRELIHQANYSIINNHDQAIIDEIQHIFQMMIAAYFEIDERMDTNHAEVIWELSEANKARRLNARIKHEEALSSKIPVEIQEEETAIREQITQVMNEPEGPQKDSLMIAVNFKYDSLILVLEKEYAAYYLWKYQQDIPDFEDIREQVLEENQQLISYFLSPDYIFILGLNAQEVDVQRVSRTEAFDENFDTFRRAINNPSSFETLEENFNAFTESGYFLYQQLVEPLDPGNESIVIIPDDKLFLLPFEILMKSPAKEAVSNYKDLAFLLKDHTISYSTSGTTLFNFKNNTLPAEVNQVLTMAPSFALDSDQDQLRSGLKDLKWSTDEIQSVAAYFNTHAFVAEQATEQAFLEEAQNYEILHIASHGILDDSESGSSKIAFALNQEDSLSDGYLHDYELMRVRLDAELAVLSACNTGYGKVAKAEGVINLARGFFISGCQSVVMTLWLANDHSTARLMDNFYDGLANGLRKDQALRSAKLQFLESADRVQAHPFYWAAFVASGNMRAIPEKPGSGFMYMTLLLGLIPFSLFLYRRYKGSNT